MTNDPLKHLLQHADSAPPLAGGSNIVSYVKRRAKRNERITSAATVAVLLIGFGLAASYVLTPRMAHNRPVVLKPDPAVAKAEIERLNAEANRHAQIADRLMQLEVASAPSDAADVQRDLQRQRDEAALSLIYQAETLAPVPAQRPAAVALYQKAIDLFPQTHWASVAKQRIEALQSTQENL